jgi:hypothetical protein
MRFRFTILALGLGLALLTPVYGATGMSFLAYGVDARATVMGQAVSSLVDDPAACYWNPAGLARDGRSELLLSHIESFAGLRREFAAVTQPAGKLTLGAAFNGIWTDNLEGYDEFANPTGSFGWSAYEAGLSAGFDAGRGLALGATAKMLREDIGAYHAGGWAADLGAQWAPPLPVPVRFGLAVKNIGPTLKFIQDDFTLPLTVQGGASWVGRLGTTSGRLTVAADVKYVRDDGTSLLVGAEYGFGGLLSFGVGYQTGQDARDVSFGLGAERGRFAFHWAYVPISQDLGGEDEHRFSLRLLL